MMSADDFYTLKETLQELEYPEILTSDSVPLVRHIVQDLQHLSGHCNDLEVENANLKARLDLLMKGSKQLSETDKLNDSYVLEIVDTANTKMEELTKELKKLRVQNSELRLASGNGQSYNLEKNSDYLIKSLKDIISIVLRALPSKVDVDVISVDILSYDSSIEQLIEFCRVQIQFLVDYVGESSKPALSPIAAKEFDQLENKVSELQKTVSNFPSFNISDIGNALTAKEITSLQSELIEVNKNLNYKFQTFQNLYEKFLCANPSDDHRNETNAMLEMLALEFGTEVQFTTHLTTTLDKFLKQSTRCDQLLLSLREDLKSSLDAQANLARTSNEYLSSVEILRSENKTMALTVENLKASLKSMKASNSNLQTELESKKKSIKDLKAMLESSKAVITNLKHQESLLKSQISDQDRKIEQLKASLNGSTTEVRSQSSATIALQTDLTSALKTIEERKQELAVAKSELLNSQSATKDLKKQLEEFEIKYKQLENNAASKKKEKDLMMNTHFKLIKANEKLSQELKLCRTENDSLKNKDVKNMDNLTKLATELSESQAKNMALETKISNLNDIIDSLHLEIKAKEEVLKVLTEEKQRFTIEINQLRSQLGQLEKSRTENYLQLAKLTERLAACNCNSYPSIIKPVEKFKPDSHVPTLRKAPEEISYNFSDLSMSETYPEDASRGILDDWARKNNELKKHLHNVQEELKNDISFSWTDSASVSVPIELPEIVRTHDKKRLLEDENKLLMDIVSQVKSDLQKAALTSPGISPK